MRRFMFIPMVVMFSCLFHGVWAFCIRCQNALQLFCIIFYLAPVNRHWWVCLFRLVAGTDICEYSLVSMSMSCLGSLSEVSSCWFIISCVMAHDVCVVLRSSSMFLVSLCYVIMGEKIIIIVLSQQIDILIIYLVFYTGSMVFIGIVHLLYSML